MERQQQVFPSKRIVSRQTGDRQLGIAAGYQQADEGRRTHAQKYDANLLLGQETCQQDLAGQTDGCAAKSYPHQVYSQ